MDAVLVTVGPQVHYEYAIALVESGYHVWTEKPCSATPAQADEMVEAAQRTGKIIQTGFNYRYTMGIRKALSLVQSGRFATPGLVTVHWWLGHPEPDHFWHHYMVHAVDLLGYLAGAGVALTHAEHRSRDGRHVSVASFRTPDGDLALLDLSHGMPIDGHWAKVDWHSADGVLSVTDFTRVDHYRAHSPERDAPYDGDHIWRTESMFKKSPFIHAWGYLPELVSFREAVQGAREPEATIEEAAWGMHVCKNLLDLAGR
jgi:predicted dehydrogenase